MNILFAVALTAEEEGFQRDGHAGALTTMLTWLPGSGGGLPVFRDARHEPRLTVH